MGQSHLPYHLAIPLSPYLVYDIFGKKQIKTLKPKQIFFTKQTTSYIIQFCKGYLSLRRDPVASFRGIAKR